MERLGDDARRLLAAAGAPEAGPLSRITEAWADAVGAPIARSAWPLRIGRDGTLHVATVSSTWAFELDRLSPELLARLRAAVGDDAPASIRFAVGPVPEAAAREESPGSVDIQGPTPEARREGAALAAAISDPELRELVARAAAASLARPPAGRGFW
jgi:predicted nucleic acid-binding Zn ribbon protein